MQSTWPRTIRQAALPLVVVGEGGVLVAGVVKGLRQIIQIKALPAHSADRLAPVRGSGRGKQNHMIIRKWHSAAPLQAGAHRVSQPLTPRLAGQR